MIKAIIIDDETHCVQSLQTDLAIHCKQVDVLASCNSAKEGIMSIRKFEPDLVFLDVEMPWMNGFEMLEIFGKINFSIIFTTAHNEFAAKAFRISAIDYLLKPVDSGDLKEAIQKVEIKMAQGGNFSNIANLLQNIGQPVLQQKIALPQRDGYNFIEVSAIIHCEAEGAYTKIYLNDGKKLLISKTLGDIEEMLPPESFQRIHHSTVVNIDYVSHLIRTDGGYVILKTGEKLLISKARKEALLHRLGLKA